MVKYVTWFELWYDLWLTTLSTWRHSNDWFAETINSQCRTTNEVHLSSNSCIAVFIYIQYNTILYINRTHSFPRQILPNSAAPFAKFRGSPRQILGIPRLTTAAHFGVYCADFGPVMPQNFSIIVTSNY